MKDSESPITTEQLDLLQFGRELHKRPNLSCTFPDCPCIDAPPCPRLGADAVKHKGEEAFVRERDEMLMAGDIDRLIAFQKKHNPDIPAFPTREVAEISLHMARTAAKSLPMTYRIESRKWLTERGYRSLDDGDLP